MSSPDLPRRRIGPLGQRLTATSVLGAAYLRVATRRGATPIESRTSRSSSRRTAGAAVAFAGPLLAISRSMVRGGARWQQPASLTGRALLCGHLAGGAVLEELVWRAPLTLPRSRCAGVGTTLLSAVGFLGLHLYRDGRGSAAAHLLTTASWTGATLLGRRLRWAMISHTLYNYAALSLRPAGHGGPEP